MSADPSLRAGYLAWVRRSAPVLAAPLLTTALVQAVSGSAWWSAGPAPSGAARYLFLSVAVAAVVVARNIRTRDTSRGPLAPDALAALSWQLLSYAIAPVVIGVALVFMTRQVWDYYLLLIVTLVGVALLFPRFDQWVAWSAGPAPDATSTETGEGGDA